jgi:hypothetical protein
MFGFAKEIDLKADCAYKFKFSAISVFFIIIEFDKLPKIPKQGL